MEFIKISIPSKAYAVSKILEIEEVEFEATSESMDEWYFRLKNGKSAFVFSNELNKRLFLGERAKENAKEYIAKHKKNIKNKTNN